MEYLKSLNKAQKEAVCHTEGPLLIVAGAGAGKTKTLTHRIVHLIANGVRPISILAVTFTNKAAGEMRERVHALLPGISGVGAASRQAGMPLVATFHSLCVRILREFAAEASIPPRFVIWDRDDSVRAIKTALKQCGLEWSPRGVLEAISRAKGSGATLGEYEERAHAFRERGIAEVWREYDKTLRAEGALDFDDLLLRSLELLQKNADVRAALQSRWSHIHIDEYQDTNRIQYQLVRILAEKHGNVCAVGDVDQCLYSWRGATIENLLSFERAFPNTKMVLLEQNYRSTRTVLAAANSVIAKNTNRVPKNLFTENDTGEPLGLFAGENEYDEAAFTALTAENAISRGVSPKEIAVLYRNNFQSRALEEAFLARNISYRVLGTRFFERKEVKDLLSYVRAALNPKSRNDIMRIIAVPPRGIGKQTLEKMFSGALLNGAAREKTGAFLMTLQKIRAACETLPASEALRYAGEASGVFGMYKHMRHEGGGARDAMPLGRQEAEERMANMFELVNLTARYDSMTPPLGIERLLEEAALQSDQDELPAGVGASPAGAGRPEERANDNAVSLMTVHAAKGLEFEIVFVTGLEQGLFPYESRSGDDVERDQEEERRLFYVALTRAKRKILLSYAQSRAKWGAREPTVPSEFLLDIDERLVEHVEHGGKNEKTIRY